MKIFLTVIYIILTSSGMFFMKLGGDSLSLTIKNGLEFKVGGITLLGLLLYVMSFLTWQKLLVTFDLSYIVPVTTGIVQIIVLMMGVLFFKEHINLTDIIGVILIIAGVILIANSKMK